MASENNMQLNIKLNEKDIITNYYFDNAPEKYNPLMNKKFKLFKKLQKANLNFISRKKLFTLY